VTRPSHQQGPFTLMLEAAGAIPIAFPLLEIQPNANPSAATTQLQAAKQADSVIFVSPNAVQFAHNLQPLPWPRSTRTRIAAIGTATANALHDLGECVDVMPSQDASSSEGLLALSAFRAVAGKHISIVCGDRGRQALAHTLIDRGASVTQVEVYRSRTPEYDSKQQFVIFGEKKPQVICITSNQGILNLVRIMDDRFKSQVTALPLIVNSGRCSKLARELGFSGTITVAHQPGDQGQLEGIQRWLATSNFNQSE